MNIFIVGFILLNIASFCVGVAMGLWFRAGKPSQTTGEKNAN